MRTTTTLLWVGLCCVYSCSSGDKAGEDSSTLNTAPDPTSSAIAGPAPTNSADNPPPTPSPGAPNPGNSIPGISGTSTPTASNPAAGGNASEVPSGAGGEAQTTAGSGGEDSAEGGAANGGTSNGMAGATASMGGSDAMGGSAPLGGATSVGVEPVGDCAPAPADASPEAQLALNAVNTVRLAAGAGCITMISELNVGALNHCLYYAQNQDTDCTADAHSEVESCAGFTGESFGDRAEAAGYDGRPAFEVMAFANDPEQAVAMWLGSVWHQLPIVSPWVGEMGYGNADNCDTIDFGQGTPLPDDTVVVYPYAGQTDVPPSFSGREGPAPPEPPTGWPSGTPITVWAQDAEITEHLLTLDGDDTPLEHVWLTPDNADLLRNEVVLYANGPLEPMTSYRVRVVGTYVGGALNLEWTFTTGESSGRF